MAMYGASHVQMDVAAVLELCVCRGEPACTDNCKKGQHAWGDRRGWPTSHPHSSRNQVGQSPSGPTSPWCLDSKCAYARPWALV